MATEEPRLPALAARAALIEPFHVMELVKRADELKRAGRSIIHLSIGEPDFTAPPPVVRALQEAAASGATGYTSALGLDALREAVAAYYRREFDTPIDSSRVLVTAGASGALLLACAGLVNPGDAVLLSDPGYPCNRHFVSALNGIARPVAVDPTTRYQLDAALVDAHWRGDVRGVLLASPSNPTGTSIAFDELGRVIEVARKRGGFAIVDEIYLGLSYAGRPRSALAHGDDVVSIGSFSKFFNMTGWRLGWLVLPPAWVPTFEKLAQNLYICASALAQRAALACFSDDAMTIYRQRREEFRARRDFIVPAVRELVRSTSGSTAVRSRATAMPLRSRCSRPPASRWCPARTSGPTSPSATCGCRTRRAWPTCRKRCSDCSAGCRGAAARSDGIPGLGGPPIRAKMAYGPGCGRTVVNRKQTAHWR
jgi:aspartate/methionine/tyrosine aminotransferase